MMANQAPTRNDYRWFMSHTTRWRDNDQYGHLNNVVHYELVDTTVSTWLSQQGMICQSLPSMAVTKESCCTYLAEMSYPCTIDAGLRVGRIGTSSIRYEVALFSSEIQEAAATAYFVHVFIDRHTRRPSVIPDMMAEKLKDLVLA